MEQADAVAFLRTVSREELLALLQEVEALQGDEVGAALAAAIAASDAPLNTLRAAHAAVVAWAGNDDARKMYAAEVADIARRIAGEMQA